MLFDIAENTLKYISELKIYLTILVNKYIAINIDNNFISHNTIDIISIILSRYKDLFNKDEINCFILRIEIIINNYYFQYDIDKSIDSLLSCYAYCDKEIKAHANKWIDILCEANITPLEAFNLIKKHTSYLKINNFTRLFTILIDKKINTRYNSDILFNHIYNIESGSILSYINDIEDTDLKIAQMEVVINYLNKYDISSLIEPIKDILYSNKLYLESKIIKQFCLNKLVTDVYIKANFKAIQFISIEALLILEDINNKNALYKELFMLENNNLLNQIFYFDTTIENNVELHALIKSIEEDYLKLAKIYTPAIEGALSYFDDMDEKALVFIKKTQILVISKAYYETWALGKNMNTPVIKAFWYINNQNKAIENPTELFKTFSLFASTYAFIENTRLFVELIKLLNLGEYERHFLDAIKKNSYNTKFVSAKDQSAFAKILEPLVEGGANIISLTGESVINIKLTEKHFKDILAIYKSINSNQDTQAAIFLCLSAIFIKYTSSKIFGTEKDSITQLRNYVLALLNKALELKPDIIDRKYLSDDKENWRYKMCGHKGAFSCAALLSEDMIREIKRKFADIFNVLLPPAWQ